MDSRLKYMEEWVKEIKELFEEYEKNPHKFPRNKPWRCTLFAPPTVLFSVSKATKVSCKIPFAREDYEQWAAKLLGLTLQEYKIRINRCDKNKNARLEKLQREMLE